MVNLASGMEVAAPFDFRPQRQVTDQGSCGYESLDRIIINQRQAISKSCLASTLEMKA
jgi:hypothetical protein